LSNFNMLSAYYTIACCLAPQPKVAVVRESHKLFFESEVKFE
jgi:hypothetical protein